MTSANPGPAGSVLTWPARNHGINPATADVNFERSLKRINPGFHARRWAALVSFGDYVAATLKTQADYSDRVHPPVLTKDIVHPAQPGARLGVVHLNDRYLAALQEPYIRKFFHGLTDGNNADRHMMLYCMQYLLGDISAGCPPAMAHPVVNAILKYGSAEIKALYVAQLTRADGHAKTAGTWGTEPLSGTNIAQTVSEVVEQPDGTLRAFGLKWFTSNAGSGVALATMRKRGAPAGEKGNRNGLTMTLLDVYKMANFEGRRINIFISDLESLQSIAHDLALNYPSHLVNIFDANQIFIEAVRVDDCSLIPDPDV